MSDPDRSDRGQAELVRRCQAGDEAAWAELYRAHGPLVARFVTRMVGATGPVDDLVQSVFIEALRAIRRFRGDARLTTWLYGLAHRVTSKHIRGEARRRRRDGRWVEEHEASAYALEPAMVARQTLARVEAAVLALPESHRAVWVMRELEGLSTSETAEALGLRLGTVRSRLFTARQQVFTALGEAPAAAEGALEPARAPRHETEDVT